MNPKTTARFCRNRAAVSLLQAGHPFTCRADLSPTFSNVVQRSLSQRRLAGVDATPAPGVPTR
jgi:hypothetical protein